MTKKEFDRLLSRFYDYGYGYEAACSDEEALECKKGMKEISETLWTCINGLQAPVSELLPVPMPESFDDLVKRHGKDVVRDWLKAMLK